MRNRFAMFAVLCTLAFLRVPAAGAQTTTALYINSQAGEPVGHGEEHTWTGNDLAFLVGSITSRSHVSLMADNFSAHTSPTIWWNLDFTSANGADLAPGTYDYAGEVPWIPATRAGLKIVGSGGGCESSGRFVIHEISFTGAGQLQSFAADFEQHCGDQVPALLGAIRYNSTRSTLVPFDGAPPVYDLHVNASPFGRVTGGGLDCGDGGIVCDMTYGPGQTVSLTATPAAGYQLLAWTLDCSGRPSPTSLVISQRKQCAAVFDAVPGSGMPPPFASGNTLLFVDRQGFSRPPADRWVTQSSDAEFEVWADPSSVTFQITGYSTDWWSLRLVAPQGQVLAPGAYERASFSPSKLAAGFSYGSSGSGYGALPRFVIYEIAFDTGGHLTRLAADFEVHGSTTEPGGIYGAIRYNATRRTVVPFDGVYPVYTLTIDPPVNGGVIAPGIDCGSGGTGNCQQTYSSAGPITVTAVPAPGHVFLGWTGDCVGATNVRLVIMTRHHCGAVFDLAPDATGSLADELRSGSLYFSGQQLGIASSRHQVWTRADSVFWVTPAYSSDPRRGVTFQVDTPDGSYWSLDFAAPTGQALGVGDYTLATRFPFQADTSPGLDVSGHGAGCNTSTGRFRIHEIQFDGSGKVTRFAADFEHHCEGAAPALFGAIRYNSTRASLLPFDGAFLRSNMSLDLPLDGSTVGPTFSVGGWALNLGEPSGTGVDAVHVYAYPASGGAPVFLGVANYGAARNDLAIVFGSRFRNSGFSLTTSPPLAAGRYLLAVHAHDTVTGTFNTLRTATITVAAPISVPRMAIDTPPAGAAITGAFDVDGWAIDTGATAGSGVDAIHVWAYKAGVSAPMFLGVATQGLARPDIAGIFGAPFGTAGYHLTVSGLASGTYTLWVAARSTVSGQFTGMTRTITVTSEAMAIDTPGDGSHLAGSFLIGGWAFDAASPSGSGVDAVHVWAVPWDGSGPVFLGVAALNAPRPDIGAIYGARFSNAGFNLVAPPLPPGSYTIAVSAHSSATGTFNQMRTVVVIVP